MKIPQLLKSIFALAFLVSASLSMKAAEPLPTGKSITPEAAKGSIFQSLNPGLAAPFANFVADHAVTTAPSPDGNTLLILTSGYNLNNDSTGSQVNAASHEYVFVYDISVHPPVKKQVVQVPNTFDGIVWNPNGTEFYVTGGSDDNIHVFDLKAGVWSESLPAIPLAHGIGTDGLVGTAAAGIAITQDGSRLIVANYENDSISIVSTKTRTKLNELDLRPGRNNPADSGIAGGEFPFWVAIKGNDTAYVSSIRDREIVGVNIATSTPTITTRIPVKGQPLKMILNKAESTLFAALDTTDRVAVIDTTSNHVRAYLKVTAPKHVFANEADFKGANPTSLALSPDEKTLYVTNGGTNSVAVIRLDEDGDGDLDSRVIGLIPTGWYPNSVSLSKNGAILYVVNGKSNTGPVPDACRNTPSIAPGSQNACSASNEYVWQRTKAGFLTLPVPKGDELEDLTEQVARNNNFGPAEAHESAALFSELRKSIKHVIYVVKENRTYDQILGDLEKGNGDPSIVVFPEAITPNFHQVARQFVDLDNFYCSGEVSGDGWNWTTSARAADSIEKTEPINYAGRGLNYDYEGTNRNINVGFATLAERKAALPLTPNDPDLLPGTADVSAADGPDGETGAGYLWDAALRARRSIRNYGFFLDLARYSIPASNPSFLPPTLRDPFAPMGTPFTPSASGTPVQVAFATKAALRPITDPFFRGFDMKFADFWRFKEWEREFDQYVKNRNLPSLELVRLPHDHFGSFASAVDGVNTPNTQMADNDYAVGKLLEKISNSIYRDSTVVFVIEDDSQDGPDHVDAHRSNIYIAGAHVKQGAVVSERYTTVNVLRTIEELLNIKPLGINDGLEEPIGDAFAAHAEPWAFTAIVPDILRTTALPLPPANASAQQASLLSLPGHDANYWEEKTRGLDFSVEDHLDTARFNRVLWQGLMGDSLSYPATRSGADLRQNRKSLLEQFKNKSSQAQAATSGGN
ncbi:MAG TPA: beta-propeller fold lactonase family protein [Terriglobales bacterium]|nr:beta-propeller fold lactonase family protein [Terriglobales bacterium]